MARTGAVFFNITGIEKTIDELQEIGEKSLKQLRATLKRELKIWLQDAKLLTPVDTGALQLSGRLNVESKDEKKFAIVFGGVSRKGKFVDYAEEVHENHPTASKFLEKVVDARSPGLADIIARDIIEANR